MSDKYKCPKCGKFNESSGICNNGALQIICKCGIVYNHRFKIDSLLSNVNSLKENKINIKQDANSSGELANFVLAERS